MELVLVRCLLAFFMVSTANASVDLSSLATLFNNSGCISLIHDGDINLDLNFPGPMLVLNLSDPEIRPPVCKDILVWMNDESFFDQIQNKTELIRRQYSRFVLAFEGDQWRDHLDESLFFKKVLDVIILNRDDERVYSRSTCGQELYELIGVYTDNGVRLKTGESFTEQHDLSCRPIQATAFHYPPFSIIDANLEGNERYSGVETRIFKTAMKKMGNTYKIDPPTDGGRWGNLVSPGRYSGLIGDVQFERSDVGWANLFVRLYERFNVVDFTSPYNEDYFCFYVAIPLPLPQWMALGLPLQAETWAAAAATMLISVTFVYFYGRWSHLDSKNHMSRAFFLLGAMVDESLPGIDNIRSLPGRLFVGIFLLSFFTLTMGYRGSLVASLSISFIPAPIDTVGQVISDPRPVVSFGTNFKGDLERSKNPIVSKVLEDYNVHFDFGTALKNLSEGTVIMAESLQGSLYRFRDQLTNEFGESSIHILSDCLTSYTVAFAIQEDSIFKKQFDDVFQKLNEAGFITKWLQEEMDKVARLGSRSSPSDSAVAKALSLNEFQAAYFVYFVFIMMALIGFTVEMVTSKAKRFGVKHSMTKRL